MSENAPEEIPALDEFDGDEADRHVGEYVDSAANVHPDGIAAQPEDFEFPEEA